jgi:hypothetical protein
VTTLTPFDHKAIEMARRFAHDPFPFPNANLLTLIDKLDRMSRENEEKLQEVYRDRNTAVQLAGVLALALGFKAGVTQDHMEPDWPLIVIELPLVGQISWHMNKSDLATQWPAYSGSWDGHTTKLKIERALAYVTRRLLDMRGARPKC